MDEVIRIAVMLASLGAAEPPPSPATVPTALMSSAITATSVTPTALSRAPKHPHTAVWPGEDRFRHVAMSWAVTSFTYAAARAADRDADTALIIGVSASAIAGLGKEIVDRREGGPFSAGDLVADVVGTGLAYLILREVH